MNNNLNVKKIPQIFFNRFKKSYGDPKDFN